MKKVILLGIEGFGGQWPEPCELSDLEIVAIVDSNPEALERAKKRFDLSDDRFLTVPISLGRRWRQTGSLKQLLLVGV